MKDKKILQLIQSESFEDRILGHSYLSMKTVEKIIQFFERWGTITETCINTSVYASEYTISSFTIIEKFGFIIKDYILIGFGGPESFLIKRDMWTLKSSLWVNYT